MSDDLGLGDFARATRREPCRPLSSPPDAAALARELSDSWTVDIDATTPGACPVCGGARWLCPTLRPGTARCEQDHVSETERVRIEWTQ
jgi:hypothetical protein